ncbi:efflux RND transporter periplasmic adaptor subunit [Maricaulis salignorans]|uniref:efflux RND transporter periplasmic adaptor subunit n=1 Tax=Maricaulis salignorans TaxID=144026 RepID=UPI003A92CF8C
MKIAGLTVNFRTVFWAMAGITLAVLLVLAFRPQPVLVDLAEVSRGALTVSVRDEARTRVREVYVVSAPLGGRLLRVNHHAGDSVAAGDVLATILPGDPALLDARSQVEARAAVRSAEAALAFANAETQRAALEYEYARTEAERIETLFGTGVASQGAVDRVRLTRRTAYAGLNTARANVARVEAELEAAQARLSRPGDDAANGGLVEIRAPIGGRLLRVLQESESIVAPGTPVLEMGDPADLEIVVEFLSTDAVQIHEGDAAEISAWGGSGTLRGRVRRIEPYGFIKVSALGVEEQRVNVIIDLLDEPAQWSALGHGYRVEAAVTIWRQEDTAQLPVAALFRSEGQWAVYRVEEGRAALTPVEIGQENGRMAQIFSGLESGDSIVMYPGPQIRDGVAVKRREAEL